MTGYNIFLLGLLAMVPGILYALWYLIDGRERYVKKIKREQDEVIKRLIALDKEFQDEESWLKQKKEGFNKETESSSTQIDELMLNLIFYGAKTNLGVYQEILKNFTSKYFSEKDSEEKLTSYREAIRAIVAMAKESERVEN